MKILQLGKFYPIRGGVEKVMLDLTTGLSAAGVSCDMLCATTEEAGVFPVGDRGRVIAVKAWGKVAATMIAPAMIGWLRAHRNEYDLIHIHHPDPMAALALRLSGYRGRVILHWHSDILSQRFLLQLYKPLQGWLIRRAEKIVGTTPAYVRESPCLKEVQDKVCFVPIGIDPVRPDAMAVAAFRARYPGKKLVFSLGRLVPYKGFGHLVDAAAFLGDDYHVLIGGGGPLREALQQRIEEQGLSGKVSLLGRVADEEVPTLFGACDVFVLSSVMKTEAFGIVQIEAMSAGKPVVATRIPGSGVAGVNEDGVSGRNVTPGNAREIAEAVDEICKNEEKYRTCCDLALQRYEALFRYGKMITKIQELYENKD